MSQESITVFNLRCFVRFLKQIRKKRVKVNVPSTTGLPVNCLKKLTQDFHNWVLTAGLPAFKSFKTSDIKLYWLSRDLEQVFFISKSYNCKHRSTTAKLNANYKERHRGENPFLDQRRIERQNQSPLHTEFCGCFRFYHNGRFSSKHRIIRRTF